MALIVCPDCAGKVSDAAPACPHCGRPMKSQAVRDREAEQERRRVQAERDAARSPIWPTDEQGAADREAEIQRRAAAPPAQAKEPASKGSTAFFVTVLVSGTLIWGCVAALKPSESETSPVPKISTQRESSAGPDLTNYSPTLPSVTPTSALTPAAPGAQWTYRAIDDEMTSKQTYMAEVRSTNTASFSTPYDGEQHAELTLRTHPRFGRDVLLTIERGQFLCSSYDGCTVDVRFDEGKSQPFSANGPESSRTTMLFISNSARFLAGLKKASRVRIAAPVYQEGRPIWDFDVTGFDAKRLAPAKGG